MITKQQISFAAGTSIMVHLLFVFGLTTILAFKRSAPPMNDNFKQALQLSFGDFVSSFGDNFYASRELNEPAHAATNQGGSVWWKWTSEKKCDVELEVNSKDFENVVGVYRGAMLETLVEVVTRDSKNNSTLAFVAEAHTTYHIAVAGAKQEERGTVDLRVDITGEEDEEELIVLLPEMFVFEEVNGQEKIKSYFRTESNNKSEIPPLNTALESDRNTLAASDLLPSEDGDERSPNIDGTDLSFGELTEKEYVDSDEEDSLAFPILPQWVSLPPTEPVLPLQDEEKQAKKNESSEINRIEELNDVVVDAPDSVFDEYNKEEESQIEPVKAAKIQNSTVEQQDLEKNIESKLTPEEFLSATVSDAPSVPESGKKSTVHLEANVKSFQAHSPKKRIVGKLNNLGEAAVDVEETALGHFKRKVDLAIQKSWHRARRANADFVKYGSLKVKFWVDSSGEIVDIRLLRNEADPVMVDFSISGILRADIPPVPKDLIDMTQDGRMEFEYEIIIY